MKPGDVVDRWTIVEVSHLDRATRARARDARGDEVELLAPGQGVDPQRFAARHRALMAIEHPSLLPTLAVLDLPDGPIAVRATAGPTLRALRGPQAPSVVAAIAARLLPAALAAARAAGPPTVDDFVLDEAGAPLLAPLGAPAHADTFDPDAATSRAVAGLLRGWATGADARAGPSHAGPLAAALADLESADPARRGAAAAALSQAAGELPDLRRLMSAPPHRAAGAQPSSPAADVDAPAAIREPARAPAAEGRAPATTVPGVGDVRLTTAPRTAPRRARLDDGDRSFVELPPDRAAALTPARRSAIAGELGVPISAIEGVIEAGMPLPLHFGASRGEAELLGREHRLQPRVVHPGGLTALILGAALAAGGAGVTALGAFAAFGALFVMSALTGLAAILVGAGALMAAVGTAALVAGARRRAAHRAARAASARIAEAARAIDDPTLGPARRAVAEARAALGQADLPDPVERDLRATLEDLSGAAEATGAALAPGWVSTDLDAIVEALRGLRDEIRGVSSGERSGDAPDLRASLRRADAALRHTRAAAAETQRARRSDREGA